MDSDLALRLKSSCQTTFSNYDQVVAVSQKIINGAFDQLYKEYPDFAKINYYDGRLGGINVKLQSPQLILGGGLGAGLEAAAALYVLR